MKTILLRFTCLLAALALLFAAAPARAQQAIALDSLKIELWPEFDKPAVLVILSGRLSSSVTLPAQITVRIPAASGGPHAVAVQDSASNNLINAQYTTASADGFIAVTLTADRPGFQVEFYDPGLTTSGEARDYSLQWPVDYPVQSATLRVQEPSGATGLTAEPPLTPSGPADFGLNYYTAALGALSAGQDLTFHLKYSKSTSTLSADVIDAGQPLIPELPQPVSGGFSPWLIAAVAALGLLLIGGGAYWFVRSNRAEEAYAAKPKTKRSRGRGRGAPASPDSALPTSHFPLPTFHYCHECGQPLLPGDKFCRNCGERVREIGA